MPGLLLATPRYDYRSADAAVHAYATRRAPAAWGLIPGFGLLVWQAYFIIATQRHTDPETARMNRLVTPFFVSLALCFATVLVTVVLIRAHRRRLRRPGPGADADAWFAATRDNVVQEGRFLLVAGAIGAVLIAAVGAVGWGPTSGLATPVALVLPALGVVALDLVTGVRDVRRPERVLAAPTRTAAPAWPLPTYLGFAWGAAIIVVGSFGAFLGDGIPGARAFTEDGQPGVEWPVVVARLAALPFITGAMAVLGWAVVALAARTAGGRLAVLATGVLLTTWVAALTDPVTGHSDRWLWFGAAPGLLIALGVGALVRRTRSAT